MTLRAWLDDRRPSPPSDLGDRVRRASEAASADAAATEPVHGTGEAEGGRPPAQLLLAAACESLDAARRKTGRVRETAFSLLTADALITYACEAALQVEDPEAGLVALLAGIAER